MPWAGWVTEAIVFGPPSGSVSLASTSIGFGPELPETVAVSLTAVGGLSSTQVTVTATVAVEPPFRV